VDPVLYVDERLVTIEHVRPQIRGPEQADLVLGLGEKTVGAVLAPAPHRDREGFSRSPPYSWYCI
jgi:hypothetical protein